MMITDVPKPKWQPIQVEELVDIEVRICEYTSGQRAFVIYKSGTVVLSDSSCPRDDEDYNMTLESAVLQQPDFTVMPMQDGNYLVRFAGPVTGVVLSHFFENHRTSIIAGVEQGGLLSGERLQSRDGQKIQQEHYYIGLYARAKLYSDISAPMIVRRFNPINMN